MTTETQPQPRIVTLGGDIKHGPKRVIFLMGPTCSGKTSIIDSLLRTDPTVGAVQVGKLMRAKYPPDYFKGQESPEHTQEEVHELVALGIRTLKADPQIRTIIVDGQPRRQDHLARVLNTVQALGLNYKFVLLVCSDETRKQRAHADREGDSLELALARIDNDLVSGYKILVEMIARRIQPKLVYTDMGHSAAQLARVVVQ